MLGGTDERGNDTVCSCAGRCCGAEACDAWSGDADDLRCKPADIVCAFNFSVCLLHDRADVQVRRPLHIFIILQRSMLGCKAPGGAVST